MAHMHAVPTAPAPTMPTFMTIRGAAQLKLSTTWMNGSGCKIGVVIRSARARVWSYRPDGVLPHACRLAEGHARLGGNRYARPARRYVQAETTIMTIPTQTVSI